MKPSAKDSKLPFAATGNTYTPLAERLRPQSLSDVLGQDHLLNPDGPIGLMLASQKPHSMILWGPPGTGKTTIARLMAKEFDLLYQEASAIFSGVADLRKLFDSAKAARETGQQTLLFIDEIHRFNKSQQDAFLPVMEDGTILLIGATTENPSFELNGALLSRAKVVVLNRLDEAALTALLARAEALSDDPLPLTEAGRSQLINLCDGDGRYLLNMVESLSAYALSKTKGKAGDAPPLLEGESLTHILQKRAPLYDKSDDSHYNLISALHKSLRGSDVDAALYWYSRMMEGGEDPLYIARRLIRFAYEDIGMADPNAALQAQAATAAYERLGSPEGDLALAQLVIFLATAPKSNAGYNAAKAARRLAKKTGSLAPPAHILNAPTKLMKDLGYGKDYQYDHADADGFSGQTYFPDGIERQKLYDPIERGFERDIIKRLTYWENLRAKKQK